MLLILSGIMVIETTVIGAYLIAGGFIALAVLQQYKRLRSKYFPKNKEVKNENDKPTNRSTQRKADRTNDNVYDPRNVLFIRVCSCDLGFRDPIITQCCCTSNHDSARSCGCNRMDHGKMLPTKTK